MEKLATSLHDILDPEPPPPTKPFVPVSLKRSVLHDVARGLSFLHSHSPPIIHRDLSARNVLLNEGMVAKIADLGMARIVPSLRASTMTKAPGASIYMPPEALEDESRYDVTIDIFSLGVLAIFTLPKCFPDLWQQRTWTTVRGWWVEQSLSVVATTCGR
ncbi:Serine/threonine-protein kinase TNNI3K [Geodia barretti]|uniref:Serine/threonine-protein kinase TNNI3K n=1 Tax=Geodia barretti TaxID=519541 RepID=A0AA35S2E0_GEOBA|nr:Serine/threonine-protein kinase TNNI3K [Geodia barretti]